MEMNALVSIIIPCYNQGGYIAETLESVVGQTYSNWEAIVINDGSTDNSLQIAEAYSKKDNRITVINRQNAGVSATRNYGLKAANGKYILPLDADDKIEHNYIKKAINIFDNQKDVKLVYCKWQFFGTVTKTPELRYTNYRKQLLDNSIFCSAIFKRDDALAIGGYDENMKTGFEDWEFFIRLLDENATVIQIPEVLFYYRIKNVSRNTEAQKQQDIIEQYIYNKNLSTYIKVFGNPIKNLNLLERYEHRNYRKQFHSANNALKLAQNKTEALAIVKAFASDCQKNKYIIRIYINYIRYQIYRIFHR